MEGPFINSLPREYIFNGLERIQKIDMFFVLDLWLVIFWTFGCISISCVCCPSIVLGRPALYRPEINLLQQSKTNLSKLNPLYIAHNLRSCKTLETLIPK